MNPLLKIILIIFAVAVGISILVLALPLKRFEAQYKYIIPLIFFVVALVTSLVASFKNELFPFAINVIPGEMTFAVPTSPSHRSLAIVLALSFINDSYSHGIVEWPALKIKTKGSVKFYTPIAEIDYEKFLQGKRKLHAENIKGAFGPFTLGAREALKKFILFSQEENNPKYPLTEWVEGDYEFEVWVKTADHETAELIKVLKHKIDKGLLNSYFAGSGVVIMLQDTEIRTGSYFFPF